MKNGIIIPCYNEAKRLDTKAFVNFISNETDYHLCFVNDGSKDNTIEVLRQIQQQCPEAVSIVDVKRNVGKAAAVRAGARYLYNRGDMTTIGFIDADLSTDFRDFKQLVKTLKEGQHLSVFFGSRNSGGDGIERDGFRKLMSNMVKFCIKIILGMPIMDTQCGAKVFSRNMIPVLYGDPFISRWLFDVEIFLRMKRMFGKRNAIKMMQEQPLMRWVHVEDSKLSFKDSIKIPLMLSKIWMQQVMMYQFKLIRPTAEMSLQYEVLVSEAAPLAVAA